MPLSAVLLVLVSTILHAGWNTRLHRGSDPEVVIALAYLFVGVVLLPTAIADPPSEVLGWLLASSVAQGLYMGLLGSAISFLRKISRLPSATHFTACWLIG